MVKMENNLSIRLLKIINNSDEPLETSEIVKNAKETRAKVLYRLGKLRGDGKIKGKQVGASKKCWIWWRIDAFRR